MDREELKRNLRTVFRGSCVADPDGLANALMGVLFQNDVTAATPENRDPEISTFRAEKAEALNLKLTLENSELEQRVYNAEAKAREWYDKYMRDVEGLNNEGDPIGGDPAMGLRQQNITLKKSLLDVKNELKALRGVSEDAHGDVPFHLLAGAASVPKDMFPCQTIGGADRWPKQRFPRS